MKTAVVPHVAPALLSWQGALPQTSDQTELAPSQPLFSNLLANVNYFVPPLGRNGHSTTGARYIDAGQPRCSQNTPARILEAITNCSQHASVIKTIHSQQARHVRQMLVDLRERAGLTQRQLARILRREHSLISRVELGERRVDVVEFFWICQACGADPARTASSLMRQFARIQADSPGGQ